MLFRYLKTRVRRLWKIILIVGVLMVLSPLFYLHVMEVYLPRIVTQDRQLQFDKLKTNEPYFTGNDSERRMSDIDKDDLQVKKPIKLQTRSPKMKHVHITSDNSTESPRAAIMRYNFMKHSPYNLLAGTRRRHKGNITIGIPSVRRSNTKVLYLIHTLKSIIRAISVNETDSVTVVILLSDNNSTYKSYVVREISNSFRPYLQSGFINIIELHPEVYPDLTRVRRTFNDSRPRLIWRAKQNIDFAYLMMYGQNLSNYYLQLEDDVIAADNFLEDIYNFIVSQRDKWFLLEFSYLGFIGKLFQSVDISWVGQFLLQHYDHAPCDLLLGLMRSHHRQLKPIHAKVTLFQHIGKFSSLKNKLMPSVDRLFKDKGNISVEVDEIPSGVYPKATINVSFDTYETNIPQNAYDGDLNSFFWGKTTKKRDSFTLTFDTPQNFSRIIILSGHPTLYTDRIYSAKLLAASALNSTEQTKHKKTCGEFKPVCEFVDGQIDTYVTSSVIPRDMRCLMIFFTRKSRWWSIIREIILVR